MSSVFPFSAFLKIIVTLSLTISALIIPADRAAAFQVAGEAQQTSLNAAPLYGGAFRDIWDSKFRDDIVWLESAGITAGCDADRFCPDGAVTREQMASFLSRAFELSSTGRDYFRDDERSKHEGAINRLAASGITAGCDDRRFCPSGRVTREQMASFLSRALELSSTSRDHFTDDNRSKHEAAINRFAAAKLTAGCADDRYCPSGTVTRGQMAAFIRRAIGPDKLPTTWTAPARPAPPISASAGILTTAAEVASLPTSGAAWNALTATAAGDWGPANVSDKNNRHGVHALSGALVYARTGDAAYRAKVIAAIEAAMAAGWSVSNGTELGVSRNLGAYAMAADLVGYRSAGFEGWLRTLLTAKVDTHSIWNVVREVSEISANNHGTFALASRTAVAIYLGDRAELDRAWAIFRGYADGSWSRFTPTADYDPAWQCGTKYIPINPACSKDGRNLDGAPVDDAARSSYPTPDGGYINEAMQGYALMGVLFSRQGYPAWSMGDNAILRVAQFQQRHGIWNYHSTGYHTGWVINHFYGANLPLAAAVPGRLLGYTDWLYGN
jgi:hypothetical protein